MSKQEEIIYLTEQAMLQDLHTMLSAEEAEQDEYMLSSYYDDDVDQYGERQMEYEADYL